jgi:hypothetical protein
MTRDCRYEIALRVPHSPVTHSPVTLRTCRRAAVVRAPSEGFAFHTTTAMTTTEEQTSPAPALHENGTVSSPVHNHQHRQEEEHHRTTKLARHQEEVRASMATTEATDALAHVAATRGLVDGHTRKLAWPKLLGLAVDSIHKDSFTVASASSHRDSHVVECDVERSLWVFTMGWSDEARDAKRRELRRVINASVGLPPLPRPGMSD